MSGWPAAALAALGFMVLIVLHELGHFVAAKKTGMRVERFALFFPPLVFKKKVGETEYGVGAIPLGGYVKISGMNPDEHFDSPDVERRAYYHQPVWKRIVVIAAGPAMNLLIAFVLLFALAFGAVKTTDQTVVGQVEPGSSATGALEPGDRILSVDGRRGDQVQQAQRIDAHRCAGKEVDGCRSATPVLMRVRRDGKILTVPIIPEFRVQEIDRMRLGFTYAGTEQTVGAIDDGSPADGVLRRGDRILSIDGRSGSEAELAEQVNSHRCAGSRRDNCRATDPAIVRVERDGQTRTFQIYPRFDASIEHMVPGFAYGLPQHPSAVGAAEASLSTMRKITTGTVSAIARIFQPEQRKQISGVVGSYEYTRKAIEVDWRLALTLLAIISLALALINLFPFLPLDGGHIFWSLVEKVRGKPVPFRLMEQASAMGFVLVLILFTIGLTNDIGRLTNGGFGPR